MCQPGSRGRGVLFGHVRVQLGHFNVEAELVEDGGHSSLRLLYIVLHRLRIADVVEPFEKSLEIRVRFLDEVRQHVIELLDQDPPQHALLWLRQPAIIEEWRKRPYETDAQRNGSVSARTNFRRMEDQQPIEPALLLIQCAAERLKPGERAIERAFLFAEWPTGCGPDGERTIRRRWAQIVGIEQQLICRKHGAAYEAAAILAIAQLDACASVASVERLEAGLSDSGLVRARHTAAVWIGRGKRSMLFGHHGIGPADARRSGRLRSRARLRGRARFRYAALNIDPAMTLLQRSTTMFDAFRQDLRHALRHLRRSPTFTLGATFTLALGIGLSAAVFSALNALVLRPVPITDPGGLIGVWPVDSDGQRTSMLAPVADLFQDGPLESVCAYGDSRAGVEANGVPVYAVVEIYSHQCFATLGVPPLMGRTFTPEEAPADRPGTRVVVIGYDFWQKVFGGAADAVGRRFRTDGDPVTVIGVMPRGFRGLRVDNAVDIIAPFGTVIPNAANRLLGGYALGRLRTGVTLEAARAEIEARWPGLMDRATPTTLPAADQRSFREAGIRVDRVGTGFSILRTRYEQALWIGSALTLGLLLLACVNVGGLALSRVIARSGELAMRTALGASRLRLARQLAIEVLAIAGAATILGIGLAWVAVKPIASALPFGGLEPTLNLAPDARVVFVTALAGLVTGLLASLLPMWLASRRETLQLHADRTVAARSRPGRVLLVVQVALSVALLMGAGLLTRSLYFLFQNHPGFEGTENPERPAAPASRRVPRSRVQQRPELLPGAPGAGRRVARRTVRRLRPRVRQRVGRRRRPDADWLCRDSGERPHRSARRRFSWILRDGRHSDSAGARTALVGYAGHAAGGVRERESRACARRRRHQEAGPVRQPPAVRECRDRGGRRRCVAR